MAGNPFFQTLDPAGAPDPVTPSDTPGDPAGYAGVTPHGAGPAPAPYSISAPQDIAGITGAVNAAGALSGAGVVYPAGPRNAETAAFLDSPQGAPAMSVTSGFPDYENTDLRPADSGLNGPIQGHTSDYQGTSQGGVPQYAGNEGGALPGVPAAGSMAASQGGNYPGTTQDGLQKYGTS